MPSHRQIEHDAAAWLARRDAGPWGEAEQAALEAWLEAATAHRVAWLRLQAAWEQSARLRALDTPARAAPAPGLPDLREVRFAARDRARPRRRRIGGAALALAACLVLAWGLGGYRGAFDAAPTRHYQSALGQTRQVALADGSQVTLGSASRIAVRLARTRREIVLEDGEAFFAVAHDRQRPFVVAAGARQAVAVGTRYAVRRDGEALRVVVTEGTVRLDTPAAAGDAATLLPAGSIAEADARGVRVRRPGVAAAERLLDWRNGLLAFRDTPLNEAVAEFNRYNRRQLVVADARAGALRVGGQFRWDNLDGFVRLLEQGFPVCARPAGQRIELRSCE